MNSNTRTLILWVIIVVIAGLIYSRVHALNQDVHEIKFSRHLEEVGDGRVKEVSLSGPTGQDIAGTYTDGSKFSSSKPPDFETYYKTLESHGVAWTTEAPNQSALMTALLNWGPLLVLVVIWIVFMRQMQAGGNKALSFGKSKAKLFHNHQKKVTFKDVSGCDEAKEDLKEIIEFLREPQKFQKLGGKIPKGVLLNGPPGTGKTLLARAISGEANVPFFSISGSDFVEMFVGVGASRVRDLFEQGKKSAPCIIFIDEIDAVGRHRGAGLGGGHDEREQTLNQLLVEMDGFESNDGVILIAATNRPDVLDPALLRPGRFDRKVEVPRPDIKGRVGILDVHTRKIPLSEDVDVKTIARGTPGFSGADLANLVNEAALRAARFNRKDVGMADFDFAKDKVLMGAERRSLIITPAEKKITAYHEAGHAMVGTLLPHGDPVHKVTIIPRGRALGLTYSLPLDERHTYSIEYLETMLAMLMGGRASEQICLSHLSSGASDDIERASGIARQMVCQLGMSALGPLTFGSKDELVFLGREISQQRDYSEATAIEIDREVKRIVTEAYDKAATTLEENKGILVNVAEALLEYETLDAEDLKTLIDGGELPAKNLTSETREKPKKDVEKEETESTRPPRPINPRPEEGPASA